MVKVNVNDFFGPNLCVFFIIIRIFMGSEEEKMEEKLIANGFAVGFGLVIGSHESEEILVPLTEARKMWDERIGFDRFLGLLLSFSKRERETRLYRGMWGA